MERGVFQGLNEAVFGMMRGLAEHSADRNLTKWEEHSYLLLSFCK